MAQDHLFISYSWANSAFVDWLALRLTAEGYKVWVDRHKIRGGQNWVKEIDVAIKEKSCRLLGVLSKSSVTREAPLNEWALAKRIAAGGDGEFFVPLMLDDLGLKELPFNLNITQYIPFHESWATGLQKLLKDLREKGISPSATANASEVRGLIPQSNVVLPKREVLWTNQLGLAKYPKSVHLFKVADTLVPNGWICKQHGEGLWWAFRRPDEAVKVSLERSVNWQEQTDTPELRPRDIFIELANKEFEAHCLRRGLLRSSNGDEEYLYVPKGLLKDDTIKFTTYNGKLVPKQLVGTRTKARISGGREAYHYHIAPVLAVATPPSGAPVVSLNLRVYLTDAQGAPLASKQIISRRKTVCRSWFNHEWLSILLAVRELLFGATGGTDALAHTFDVGQFQKYGASFGLDDAKIEPMVDPAQAENDVEVDDDEEE